MWNWLGIISTTIFIAVSPEIQKISDHRFLSLFDEKIICNKIDGVHFCLTQMNPNSTSVVYFFPGVLHNQMAWMYQRKNFNLRKMFFLNQRSEPNVITISVHPLFMAKQTDKKTQNLIQNVFPKIEDQFHLKIKDRIFYGNSLGAYNAFELAYQAMISKKITVQKLILGCPLIPVQNPFSALDVQSDYVKDTHQPFFRFWLLQAFQRFKFQSDEDWEKSSPLHLAYQSDMSTFPKTLIVGGKNDEFMFMEGAARLAKIFDIKKVPHRLELIDGHHCVVDLNAIKSFIEN